MMKHESQLSLESPLDRSSNVFLRGTIDTPVFFAHAPMPNLIGKPKLSLCSSPEVSVGLAGCFLGVLLSDKHAPLLFLGSLLQFLSLVEPLELQRLIDAVAAFSELETWPFIFFSIQQAGQEVRKIFHCDEPNIDFLRLLRSGMPWWMHLPFESQLLHWLSNSCCGAPSFVFLLRDVNGLGRFHDGNGLLFFFSCSC